MKNQFLETHWRSWMAILYILLCFLDYGVRPLYNVVQARKFDLAATIHLVSGLPASSHVPIITAVRDKEIWPPILPEFAHLAFGAVLGVAAYGRRFRSPSDS